VVPPLMTPAIIRFGFACSIVMYPTAVVTLSVPNSLYMQAKGVQMTIGPKEGVLVPVAH
jgi:hypothetical protein